MLPIFLVLISLAADPGTAQFEADGVRIDVSVSSHIYQWQITNNTDQPIMGFEFDQHHLYNQLVPDGWKLDDTGDRFRAWTDESHYAIAPNQARTFSARVSSAGAVLGQVPAICRFDGEREPAKLAVWAPVREPIAKFVITPVVIGVLAVCHARFRPAR